MTWGGPHLFEDNVFDNVNGGEASEPPWRLLHFGWLVLRVCLFHGAQIFRAHICTKKRKGD